MKTSDIRRVIDASLDGMKLSPEERRALAERAMDEKDAAPPRAKGRTRLARRLLLAAAIAILTLALIVPAVGGSERTADVADRGGTFELHYEVSENFGAPEGVWVPESVGALWGEAFRDGLLEMNAMVMLPKWAPDGYALSECDYLSDFDMVLSKLVNGDGQSIELRVHVWPEDSSGTVYQESEEDTTEEWVYGGVTYYYTTNYDRNTVSWFENNCTVDLNGPRDRETMREIIESIYEAD